MDIWPYLWIPLLVVLTIGGAFALAIPLGASKISARREVRACRECGCTDMEACAPFGCYWVDLDLCSACAPEGDR